MELLGEYSEENSHICTSTSSSSSLSSSLEQTKFSWMSERDARKYAEKQRRAKFNAEIHELAKVIPHGGDGQRKMEKMEILRLATHGLRLKYIFNQSTLKGDCNQMLDELSDGCQNIDKTMTNAFLHLMDSFFITLTCNGQILLISPNIEEILGYNQCDLYGQNILQITHPKDRYLFREQLIPSAFEKFCEKFRLNTTCPEQQQNNNNNNSNNYNFLDIDRNLQTDRRCFTVRLIRSCGRFERPTYELVKIDGSFRRSDASMVTIASWKTTIETSSGTEPIENNCCRSRYPLVSQLIRRSNYPVYDDSTGSSIPHMWQHEILERAALYGVNGNDIVFIAMARIIRPSKISNWPLEATCLEYKTRHLIDGRIVDCDHRISLVAGYLSSEVHNLSPFSFMHQDDVRWVVVALRQMYDCNSYFGESFYRLLSRNGNFIYLHTKGFMEIDKMTNQVHSFVCINTLLDETIGRRKVQEMKNKFSVIINAKVPQTKSRIDLPASQNPQQLERIVLYLIENLQKREQNDDMNYTRGNNDTSIGDGGGGGGSGNGDFGNGINNGDGSFNVKELCNCNEMEMTMERENGVVGSSTTILDLVAPEPATVRSSITRSIDIINQANCDNTNSMQCHQDEMNAKQNNVNNIGQQQQQQQQEEQEQSQQNQKENQQQEQIVSSNMDATLKKKFKRNYQSIRRNYRNNGNACSVALNVNVGVDGDGDGDADADANAKTIPLPRIRYLKLQKPTKVTKLTTLTCQMISNENMHRAPITTTAKAIHALNNTRYPFSLSLKRLYSINNNYNNQSIKLCHNKNITAADSTTSTATTALPKSEKICKRLSTHTCNNTYQTLNKLVTTAAVVSTTATVAKVTTIPAAIEKTTTENYYNNALNNLDYIIKQQQQQQGQQKQIELVKNTENCRHKR